MTAPSLYLRDRVELLRAELARRPSPAQGARTGWDRRLAVLAADVAQHVAGGQPGWRERQDVELDRLEAALKQSLKD